MTAPARVLVVMGQGYAGLPLTVRAVEAGFDVIGFDVDARRVDQLRAGRSCVDDIDDKTLSAVLATGRWRPTCDAADLSGFDIAVVAVPTPLLAGQPDLGHVRAAALALGPHIRPGCCVVLESTTWPGTTVEVFAPLLEEGSGLRAARDFHVGYSPERIDPGNPTWTFRTTPKIVSGVGPSALAAVTAFYRALVDDIVVVDVREAELAKLLENTFRQVNIALVNELSVLCEAMGVDVRAVVDAAATKPFGFLRFDPGPGVGGACLTTDPSYLSWHFQKVVGRGLHLVDAARAANEQMPDRVVDRVVQRLHAQGVAVADGRLVLLGLTYKRNSSDARESPAVAVAERLVAACGAVQAIDPLVDPGDVPAGVTLIKGTEEELAAADLLVILTDHDAIDWRLVDRHAGCVVDARHAQGVRHARPMVPGGAAIAPLTS